MDRGGLAAVLAAVVLASAALGSPDAPLLEDDEGQSWAPPPVDAEASNATHRGSAAAPPPLARGPAGGPPPRAAADPNSSPGTGSTTPEPEPKPKPKPKPSERSPSAPGSHSYPTTTVASPPREEGGKGGLKGGGDAVEKCYGAPQLCTDNVTACFSLPQNGADELFILVQNKGSDSVVISALPATETITIPKNGTRKIRLPSGGIQGAAILKVGGNTCFLESKQPVLPGSFFQQLPSYATPQYGAYALFLSALVAGGAWACCKCQKRSRMGGSGILYQQLEMGLHESTSAVDTHVGEGWDEGWEDSWQDEDEEAGPRVKETLAGGGVSENGTAAPSSKPPVRDDWEDWDD